MVTGLERQENLYSTFQHDSIVRSRNNLERCKEKEVRKEVDRLSISILQEKKNAALNYTLNNPFSALVINQYYIIAQNFCGKCAKNQRGVTLSRFFFFFFWANKKDCIYILILNTVMCKMQADFNLSSCPARQVQQAKSTSLHLCLFWFLRKRYAHDVGK